MMNQVSQGNGQDTADVEQELPIWVVKMARRMLALGDGRHVLILTKDGRKNDLTVLGSGKVEHLS